MAIRCSITIRDMTGREYRIYRHGDGRPEDVVSDLWLFSRFYDRYIFEDPEYFLANFIFYAKLRLWIKYKDEVREQKLSFKPWEFGYGVCAPNCEHGDLEYKYLIYPKNGKAMLKIEKFNYASQEFEEIFNDNIRKAIEKWAREEGCHLKQELLKV